MVREKFSTTLPEGYDYLELNSGKSINVNLNFFAHDFPIYKRTVLFTTGIGLTLNNYRFSSDKTLIPDTNRVVAGFDTDKNGKQINYEKNKLSVNYITLPLLLQFNTKQQFKKSFHIATGLLLSYKFNSHLKLVYNDDGDRENPNAGMSSTPNPSGTTPLSGSDMEHYTLYLLCHQWII
ncbi:MAG: outer membrane beta-barrel protein [Bacteroidetes bacterium]|nr:outer membrane beta-barrel protein [Bacteroidota bacterium]